MVLPSTDQQAPIHQGGIPGEGWTTAMGLETRWSQMRRVPSMEVSRNVEDEVCGRSSSVVLAWPFVISSSAWGLPVERGSG